MMPGENAIIPGAFKRFVKKQRVLLVLIFILLMAMAQFGFIDYNITKNEVEKSPKLEKIIPDNLKKYTSYGVYGVRFNSLPSPFSFLVNFKPYHSLIASVNSGTGLKIYDTKKGRNALIGIISGYLSYSGLFLLMFSILYFNNGWASLRDRKGIKFYASVTGLKKVLGNRLAVSLIFLTGFLLVILACTGILGLINGINLFQGPFFIFSLKNVVIFPLFFLTGAIAARVRKGGIGFKTALVVVFGVSLIAAPILVAVIPLNLANRISEFETEYNQFDILRAFENRGIKNYGDLRSGDDVKNFMKGYSKNELALIEKEEKKLFDEIEADTDAYFTLANLCLTTFYLTTDNEISGQGLNNYMDFYAFARTEKRRFFDFWVDKKYFSAQPQAKVESYITDDKNIYHHRSSLPPYFFLMLAVYFAIDIALGAFTVHLAKKSVFPVKEKLPEEDQVSIIIDKGYPFILYTTNPILKDKIYNHVSGVEKTKIEIDLKGTKVKVGQADFVYLVNLKHLDDISSRDLNRLLFNQAMAKNREKWEILADYAAKKEVIIMDGFAEKLHWADLKDILIMIKEKGLYCLLITSDFYFTKSNIQEDKYVYYLYSEPAAEIFDELYEAMDEKEKSRNALGLGLPHKPDELYWQRQPTGNPDRDIEPGTGTDTDEEDPEHEPIN